MNQTIVDKLTLNNYHHKTILNAPPTDYFQTLATANLSFSLTKRAEDLVILFVYSKTEMMAQIKDLTKNLTFNKNGYLFVAYPKIGSPNYPNTVHRDEIFPALGIDPNGDGYLPNTDFKFSRMVKLDDDFTVVGLKYLPIRGNKKTASQRVGDYSPKVPDLQQRLAKYPKTQLLFKDLTPGYQRNWARYVYSPKQVVTQEKRFEEMQTILNAGFKSKNLYQKNN